ncbi:MULTISPECIES: hypothetical protein [unclassified Bradyrhizobium]|uniref:hypothetical protein n=1 Tax=unclassified Bradyrhizobium TaxID=2631580 RepID=UPI002FEF2E33
MSRISFAVPIATGLILTTYFGLAAWRLSKDGEMDIKGQIALRTEAFTACMAAIATRGSA